MEREKLRHEAGSLVQKGRVPFGLLHKDQAALSGRTLRPGGLSLTRGAVEICGFKKGDFILDAGCGYGMSARFLAQKYQLNVTGLDRDCRVLKQVRKSGFSKGGKIHTVTAHASQLPFGPERFNGIFCEFSFSKFRDKKKSAGLFYQLLKQNGRLVITDLFVPQLYAASFRETVPSGRDTPCINTAMTLLEMIRVLEDTGFEIEIMENHAVLLDRVQRQITGSFGSGKNPWKKMMQSLCGDLYDYEDTVPGLRPGLFMIIAAKYH